MTLQDIQIPFSDDAERGVLSCMICRHDVVLNAQLELKDEHFYHPANKLIFQTIKTMVAEERPTELPAMSVFFMDMGLMDKIGGPATLAELYSFVPTPAHYDYYRDILKQKLKLRKIIAACTEVLQSAQEVGNGDADVLVDAAGEKFFEIAAQEQTRQGTFKEKLMEYTNVWEARALGQVETGIPTRWRSWNTTFGGITPRMWLIAGYPSDGKSSVAQGLVEDTLVHGGDVLWFMYEMDDTETIDRLVSSRSQLESKKVFFPQHHPLQQGEAKRVSKAVGEMMNFGLHLRCEPTWTVEQIVAETRAMKRRNANLKLVVVDYLQLVPTAKDFGSKRSDQVAYISRTLKRDVSAANKIAVVVLSQLNDDGKTLDSRAPGQDASNVLSIEPAGEMKDPVTRKTVKKEGGLRVSKNRNGPKGHLLPIRLEGATFSFEERDGSVVRQ